MKKLLAMVFASCQLAGCATTGGRISLAATAGSVVGFASTFKLAVFCSPQLSPCPDNTAAGVFALTALAAAVTGITFEVVNLAMGDDEPAGKPVPITRGPGFVIAAPPSLETSLMTFSSRRLDVR